MQLEATKHF